MRLRRRFPEKPDRISRGNGVAGISFDLPKGDETMFTQLNPTLPLHVIDKGDGYAIGIIDYGQEHNLIWVTVLNESGEIWCAPNPMVRFGKNWTMGRSENPLIVKGKQGVAPTGAADAMCEGCADILAH